MELITKRYYASSEVSKIEKEKKKEQKRKKRWKEIGIYLANGASSAMLDWFEKDINSRTAEHKQATNSPLGWNFPCGKIA